MSRPAKPAAESLVLNTHCIANFQARAQLHSVVLSVSEIRRLFEKAVYAGEQDEPRGRAQGKRLKAPTKPLKVTLWQVFEGSAHWVFFVRGTVLLTVHRHEVRK